MDMPGCNDSAMKYGGMAFLIYHMVKMNFEFMIFNKVRKHEEEYHAKELKEREKP